MSTSKDELTKEFDERLCKRFSEAEERELESLSQYWERIEKEEAEERELLKEDEGARNLLKRRLEFDISATGTPIMKPLERQMTEITSADSDVEEDELVIVESRPPLEILPLKRQAAIDVEELEEEVKEKGKQVKRFCMTYNNPTVTGDEFKVFLDSKEEIAGYVFQLEEGEQGTEHFQGYLEFKNKKTTMGVHKTLVPHKAAIFYANGTKAQNNTYCTKAEGRKGGPWYDNAKSTTKKTGTQGKRSDLDRIAERVLEDGGITRELLKEVPGMISKYGKGLKDLLATQKRLEAEETEKAFWIEQARLRKEGKNIEGQKQRQMELFFGPTAVGKTTEVKIRVLGELQEDLYTKDCSNKWWCGYNAHKNVIMDEFKGDSFGSIEAFNAISNIGCQQVETKGGQTILIADRMFFTTNRHPCHWWKKGDDHSNWYNDPRYKAVARRFAKVHWWNDDNVLTVIDNPGPNDGSLEWDRKNLAWTRFWKWKEGPATEGYTATAGPDMYFSLYDEDIE